MRYFITVILAAFFSVAYGQYTREEAREDLLQLKNGALLVRLHTNDAAIGLLESRGQTREAERLKEQQYRENKEILLSFAQTFDFCPVYFFYSGSSEAIRKGNFEGNVFDAQQEFVESNELPENIFTAEFSETENLGIDGLILMNVDLFPLEAPFPFYQRKYIMMGLISLSKARMIESYNKKLHSTYGLWFPDGAPADTTLR